MPDWPASHIRLAGALTGRAPVARLVASTVLLLTSFAPAQAQIYVGTLRDAAGTAGVVLSNFASDATPHVLIAAPPRAASAATSPAATENAAAAPAKPVDSPGRRLPDAHPELHRLVDEVAAQVQISPALLHAVIATESRYDARAVSAKGAVGLMQVLPATALRFGVRDAHRPRDNVYAGASYLKWLMALFDNDLELALAAYNAGENAVFRAGRRIPPYPETMAYVPRVLAYLRCANDATCRRG